MVTSEKYTGPNWVGPLFKWLGVVAVMAYVLGFNYEVEFDCYGDNQPTKDDLLDWRVV